MTSIPHRSVSNIRPSTTRDRSPSTPLRSASTLSTTSSFSSPSALRAEEDCLILDIGTRSLRVGLAGDAVPKAVIPFGPEEQRRAGDYRRWMVGYEKSWRDRVGGGNGGSQGSRGWGWGEEYELWRMDTRGLDLGLVGDKIERAMRSAITTYLVTGSHPRRILLILPSEFPLPLLSTTLDTLFAAFQPPSISLSSGPVLSTIAAGLRSSLVIDIGWAETTVTAVYEYREVQCRRSVRGSKRLGREMLRMLAKHVGAQSNQEDSSDRKIVSFEETEEVLMRMAWCRPSPSLPSSSQSQQDIAEAMKNLGLEEEIETTIPLRSTEPPMNLKLPFEELAEPVENALFAKDIPIHELDDEELPLHLLIYRSLLHLPVDVRSTVMSRIIVTGGSSQIPCLKTRLIAELHKLIDERGWDPVTGKVVDEARAKRKLLANGGETPPSPTESEKGGYHDTTSAPLPASQLPQVADPIESHIKREKSKESNDTAGKEINGVLRALDSMGAWAGGSLVSHLRLPSMSTVDREQWMSQGLQGARARGEVAKADNRKSARGGLEKGESNGWTLGAWA